MVTLPDLDTLSYDLRRIFGNSNLDQGDLVGPLVKINSAIISMDGHREYVQQ